MASVSSSTLILFIASILVAASVAGTMTTGVQRLGGALSDRSVDVSQEIRTDIEIINDPGSPSSIYNNGTITLLVKNTGSQTLSATRGVFDILIDGRYVTPGDITQVEVVGGGSWQTGDVVRLTITQDIPEGDHRIAVTVNGDEELLKFRTS